jgi:flagellar biosynthetic protein FliR
MIVLDDAELMNGLLTFFLLSLRLSAMFLAAPIFSAASITVPVRVMMTVTLAAALYGSVRVPAVELLSIPGALLITRELLIGIAMGFIMQLAFAAVAMAGEQISFSMGLSFAAMVDPQTGTQSPVITQFLTILLILVFLTIEGHHLLLRQLYASYAILPIGGDMIDTTMFLSLFEGAALIFSAALLVSLPIVVSLFLVNLTIGMLTRVAPQMNIFSVGFPLTILVGLALLLVNVPSLATGISGILDEAGRRLREIALVGAGR